MVMVVLLLLTAVQVIVYFKINRVALLTRQELNMLVIKGYFHSFIPVKFCSIFLTADDTKVQGWTCGYRGACRKYCYAQEYMVGYHGCPRRLRYYSVCHDADLYQAYFKNIFKNLVCLI